MNLYKDFNFFLFIINIILELSLIICELKISNFNIIINLNIHYVNYCCCLIKNVYFT